MIGGLASITNRQTLSKIYWHPPKILLFLLCFFLKDAPFICLGGIRKRYKGSPALIVIGNATFLITLGVLAADFKIAAMYLGTHGRRFRTALAFAEPQIRRPSCLYTHVQCRNLHQRNPLQERGSWILSRRSTANSSSKFKSSKTCYKIILTLLSATVLRQRPWNLLKSCQNCRATLRRHRLESRLSTEYREKR